MKVVLTDNGASAGSFSLFPYTNGSGVLISTENSANAIFSAILNSLETLTGGPEAPTPNRTSFANTSVNNSALSNVVKNAHLCRGGFIAMLTAGIRLSLFHLIHREGLQPLTWKKI